MMFPPIRRPRGRKSEANSMSTSLPATKESTLFKTVGWVSAGLGAVALGLVVGNELRQRYKFNRRTPYDNYGHSADTRYDLDSGLGV
jgi:hypothetical protein